MTTASSKKKEAMAVCGSRRGLPYTWQCIWALAVAASMIVYSLALFNGPSSSSSTSCARDRSSSNRELAAARSSGGHGDHESLWEWRGDLRQMEAAWNRLCFGPIQERLRIALFVKKWPVGGVPGGLERHALTLHRNLAARGHEIHVYTSAAAGSDNPEELLDDQQDHGERGLLHVHFSRPNAGGGFDYHRAWDQFLADNSTHPGGFDIVHSESVALPHWKAQLLGSNLAASWHGIGYEIIHSDLVQDLVRKPGEPRSADLQRSLGERLTRVADEIKFFPSYRHHVATSDYVGDVLQTIYEIPLRNVHTILNGVDESRFRPSLDAGSAFRRKYGVPVNASLVFGAAGRLVRDKGHPLLFEAFSRIAARHPGVFLLVAGHGPWGDRYRELAPNAKTLGPMDPAHLADFYNALDVFVNPTLRSQGLDHTLLEAMQCGKPLLATHFSSITWSVVVSSDFGHTFSPNVDSLEQAMEAVIAQGRDTMRRKGELCRDYASLMFTATKMGAAYERLFLCMKNESYCQYPLPGDCPVEPSKY
ncbi:uncharacterized protein LOC9643618 [Selaginella moellendorffii]|nr:uncharacterized protein LOC9643618 [Selaginella moellendorffii]|eukprot:XP_002963408.2 uncharacterized protein LOC9643618 [Selaginella moellendorffii]